MRCRQASISTFLRHYSSRKQPALPSLKVPRPYQEQALNSCLRALESGLTRIAVSIPCALDRDVVLRSLISRPLPQPHSQRASRFLIIADTLDGARKTVVDITTFLPERTVEREGTKSDASGTADVTVAAYRTLVTLADKIGEEGEQKGMEKFDPTAIKAVIIEQLDLSKTKYESILSNFHSDIGDGRAPAQPVIIGLSTRSWTEYAQDKLEGIFEYYADSRDFIDTVGQPWSPDVKFNTVHVDLNLKDVVLNPQSGDFDPTSLAQIINTAALAETMVDGLLGHTQASRTPTIVFCVDAAHGSTLAQAFLKHGVESQCVSGDLDPAARDTIFEAFKRAEFHLLIICDEAKVKGVLPAADCIVIAHPTRSRTKFARMAGRGASRIIEFVDRDRQVDNVMSIPATFGLDPEEIGPNDETRLSLVKRVAKIEIARERDSARISDAAAAKAAREFDYLWEDFLLPKQSRINALTAFTWVPLSSDVYILPLMDFGFIRIELKSKKYNVMHNPRRGTVSHDEDEDEQPIVQVLTSSSLPEALEAAEVFVVANIFDKLPSELLRSGSWRLDKSSDLQRRMIRNMLSKRWPNFDGIKERDLREITAFLSKRDASYIIEALVHGSKADVEKLAKQIKAAATNSSSLKALIKAEKMRLKAEYEEEREQEQGVKTKKKKKFTRFRSDKEMAELVQRAIKEITAAGII